MQGGFTQRAPQPLLPQELGQAPKLAVGVRRAEGWKRCVPREFKPRPWGKVSSFRAYKSWTTSKLKYDTKGFF